MRRYDLDWLRVIVFGLLIFYHVGMFFVPWGWHIKNNVLYEDLTWPMRFLNQWRLPILFVISGMGSFYALNKRNGFQFMGERIKRLLIPLIFGMAVIVPVQVYAERVYKGEFQGGYFDFWPQLAFIGVYPEGNISW
ncbi:glucan biosynthesis protein, partial [Marivirga lumbricoides]